MKGDLFIKFRDEEEACIGFDVDCSGPGSGCAVEWWFADRDGPEADALNVTPEEEEAIVQQCIEAAEGRYEHHDDDVPLFGIRDPAEPIGTALSQVSGRAVPPPPPDYPKYEEFVRIAKTYGYD